MDVTEKFDDRDSFLHWFIIASLTGVEITEEIRSRPMVVTMQINGEEVNPANYIKRLGEEFDRMVNDKSQEAIEDLRDRIIEKLDLGIDSLIGEVTGDGTTCSS